MSTKFFNNISGNTLFDKLKGIASEMKTFERLVIEAAIKGDRDLAVTALNMNPLCPSDEIANTVIDELLEAHKDYLPQFFNK